MRTDPVEFTQKKKGLSQEPFFLVEISFDLANTDKHYITSHQVDDAPNPVTQRALRLVSGNSQKLNPAKANSTIGSMRFEVLDFQITELLRTKLNENKGLKGKRVRIYKGFKGLLWSQFRLVNTYIFANELTFKDGVYTFNCSDVQRTMKQNIFTETTTAIMAPVKADDTTIDVFDASKFKLVYQPPGAAGRSLLRGLQQRVHPSGHAQAGQLIYPQLAGVDHIGLITLPGDEDKDEIAIWTGKTGNTLTGLIRGVLGTKAVDVEVESGLTLDEAPKVTEYVYIEMPAVKAVYAILTGSIYGAPGEFLPDHWHLGISTDYVQTSSFINIGPDLWDLTNDENGYPVVIKGAVDVEAKKYVEEKLLYMIGLYMPINSEGELTLKRMQYIGPNGSYSALLNESNIISHSDIKYDLSQIQNTFVIKWNYEDSQERFTRTSVLYDSVSIQRYGASDPKIIEMETLHGSRHSDSSIRYHFDSLRSRYSGPPIIMTATLTPDMDGIEVGDIVRVSLEKQEDYTNESGPLNRNYEVQQVSVDAYSGRIKVDLFGSSQRASDLPPENPTTVADLFLVSEGTEINATNFPGAVSSANGTTTITGNITLAGNLDLRNSSAVYYCSEDLTIDAGAVVTITNNVQLRVRGFLEVNGLIDGKGRGHAGGVSDGVLGHVFAPVASNLGKSGIGRTQAGGGWSITYRQENTSKNFSEEYRYEANPTSGLFRFVNGQYMSDPFVVLTDSGLKGLPVSLIGTSGSSGAANIRQDYSNTSPYNLGSPYIQALGGNGGNSGAGLAIFSKGMDFGFAGVIDLSGDDGLPGNDDPIFFNNYPRVPSRDVARAGAGAGGCPGGLLICMVESQTFPDKDPAHFKLESGKSPNGKLQFHTITTVKVGGQTRLYRYPGSKQNVGDLWGLPASQNAFGGGFFYENDNWQETNTWIRFLNIQSEAIGDVPAYVEPEPTFTLTEKTNTPVTPSGDRSSIEVSVTRPIFSAGQVDNYSYSLVDYRKLGDELWISAMPASPESVIEVPSDGSVYEVRIRSVSTSKRANDTGPVQTISITDINGKTDAELALIYPLELITGLTLKDQASTVFSGLDAEFEWEDSNSGYIYFNYYQVTMLSGATVLRTEKSVSPFYTYSLQKNMQDYLRINSTKGVYNDLEIQVKPVSKYLNINAEYYSGTVEALIVSSSNVDDRDNLRFYLQYQQQFIDDLAIALQQNNGGLIAYYQPDEPTSPNTGDLWFDTDDDNSLYRYNGTAWEVADNSKIAEAIQAAQTAETIADGKAYVFYQNTAPTNPVPTEGDLWFNPDSNILFRYTSSTWSVVGTNGATWGGNIEGQPADSEILNNISYANGSFLSSVDNGYFKSTSGPTGAIRIKLPIGYLNTMVSFDIEVNQYSEGSQTTFSVAGLLSSSLNKWAMTTAKATTSKSSNTFTVRFGMENFQAVVYIGETSTNWAQPEVIVRNVRVSTSNYDVATWKQNWSVTINSNAFQAVTSTVTDTFIVSSDTLKVGGIPAATLTQDIATALSNSQNAQAVADGKIAAYYQASQPSGADIGDLWFDTDDGNKLYRYSGSSWVLADDIRIGQALTAAQTAETIADGKAYVYYQTTTPTSPTPTEGDLWYNTSTKQLRRLTSGTWQVIGTNGADWGDLTNIPIRLTDTASVGLNLTATYMGYNSNGTAGGWKTYINDQGHLYLNSGASNNYLSWNGTTLTVRGDIDATKITSSIAKIGFEAGLINQGASALSIGDSSGRTNQGAESIAVGKFAGTLDQGAYSVAVGLGAGQNYQGLYSVALGWKPGQNNQGDNSVAIGYLAGVNSQSNSCIAIGTNAGRQSQGTTSIAIGYESAYTTQGIQSVAVGTYAGRNSQGSYAVAIGYDAGKNSQGTNSIAIGHNAGSTNLDDQAIAIGVSAAAEGGSGVALGFQASAKGLNSIAIGNVAGGDGTTAWFNWTCLGNASHVTGSNQVQLGNSSTTTYAYGAVQNRSDERDKSDITDTVLGLSFINALRPVDFRWDYREDYREYRGQPISEVTKTGANKRTRKHHGLIAQEVKAVMDSMGIDFAGYQDHTINGGDDVKSLGYEELIAPMIKAIQELKAEIDEIKAILNSPGS